MATIQKVAPCLWFDHQAEEAATFNEAISLQVYCDTQKEIDYFRDKLGAGGPAEARPCGWLKDKY